ncbi:MAG: DUF4143 domain-containing protein [Clostridiales bacterium]|jgi:predicted AAA+ superfamily ATPase|nr:DUF4143 domain-containing protein [Clostridiales bacterium]
MQRLITNELLEWKNQKRRMPLLVYGARQVGKTHIIKEFGGENYKNTAYVNLETNALVNGFFDDDIEPKKIIMRLETHLKERILPNDTLIFFDEVQASERALTSLKYFNENAPEYHIAAAGSLLGVAIKRENFSFPVGNVDSKTMFPFDFEEFLWSQNEERLAQMIKKCFIEDSPMPKGLHERAIELYKIYLIVGGMPRAILEYNETNSLLTVPDKQNKIINDYIADMAKYADEHEAIKIRAAYNSITAQLAKNNKKFQYKVIQKGGSATIFGEAIDWLDTAKVVNKCNSLNEPTVPLDVYKDLTSFKLYMSDTGLLTMKSKMPQDIIMSLGNIDNKFLGAIAENYVAQHLTRKGIDLLYWRSDSKNGGKAEVDFVMQDGSGIVPIEVKAGDNVTSKSLSVFVKKFKPKYSIRISTKNFGFENGIKSVPLYAVFCI